MGLVRLAPCSTRGPDGFMQWVEAPCRARGEWVRAEMIRDFGWQEEAKRWCLEGKG
jgi:hypothetical protein